MVAFVLEITHSRFGSRAPDLSLSRARRPVQLVHQRSRMVSARLATQATLVHSDMCDSFRDEKCDTATRRHHARSVPAVRPRRLVTIQGGCGARRVVLVPLQAHLDLQDRSVGSRAGSPCWST